MANEIRLSELVGGGYDEFWECKKFYRLVKGSKGSKKSKTTALWYIKHMMAYPLANLLVVRHVYGTLRESCFDELLWAIDRLQVSHLWTYTTSPLKITYEPTKQVILFRGFDKVDKLMSISTRKGFLCWVWIEEASDIVNEAYFDRLMMSIRGKLPPESGLWKQITLTFNPWSADSWLKKRFFDNPNPDKVWTATTTYRDNEFLGEEDIANYEELYIRNPRAARVICDGDWGIAEGLIYENWEELPLEFDMKTIFNRAGVKFTYGLDFGYKMSFNAFVAVAVDLDTRELWVFDEMYERNMTNLDIARKICELGYGKEEIWADSSEPKSINELRSGQTEGIPLDDGAIYYEKWALPNVRPAMKGPDSVNNGIQRLQSFKMWIHPKCRNVIMELNNYCWDTDKDGRHIGKPIKDFDHALDALRYSMEKYFIRARGHVVEVKGGGIPLLENSTKYKSKRVVSSH